MTQKSITRFLHHSVYNRFGFLDFKNTMVLSLYKLDNTIVLVKSKKYDSIKNAMVLKSSN